MWRSWPGTGYRDRPRSSPGFSLDHRSRLRENVSKQRQLRPLAILLLQAHLELVALAFEYYGLSGLLHDSKMDVKYGAD